MLRRRKMKMCCPGETRRCISVSVSLSAFVLCDASLDQQASSQDLQRGQEQEQSTEPDIGSRSRYTKVPSSAPAHQRGRQRRKGDRDPNDAPSTSQRPTPITHTTNGAHTHKGVGLAKVSRKCPLTLFGGLRYSFSSMSIGIATLPCVSVLDIPLGSFADTLFPSISLCFPIVAVNEM